MKGENLKIHVVGVGGQGVILFSRIVGSAAQRSGKNVIMSEIHGMSQRGGVVESSVVIGRAFSPMIEEGAGDVLVAFEPVEAARQKRMIRKSGIIITSTNPLVPATVGIGLDIYPGVGGIIASLKEDFESVFAFDAPGIAANAGSSKIVSAVFLGALAGIRDFPLSGGILLESLLEIVPAGAAEMNTRGFKAGMEEIWRLQGL